MPDPARTRPVPVPRPRPGGRVVLLAAAFLLTTTPAPAQPADDPLPALRLRWLTQLARQDAATWEVGAVAAPRGGGPAVGNFQDPSVVLKELRPVLAAEYDTARAALGRVAAKAKARRDEAEKAWAGVVGERAAFRRYADARQADGDFDLDAGTHTGWRPTVLDAILLAAAAVAAVVALRLRGAERRLEDRKARRAVAAGLLAGVLAVPGCGNPAAGAGSWAGREEADLTAKLADATAKADAAEVAADKKWRAAADGWAALVAAPGSPAKEDVEGVVRAGEADLRDRLRAVLADSVLAERLAADAEEQQARLAAERAKFGELASGARWRNVAGAAVRVALAAVLFGLAVAPFWAARRDRARRARAAARTCPRCFRRDTLRVEKAAPEPKGKYRPKGKKPAEPEDDPDEPAEDLEARCGKCGLRIRNSYRAVPRLCFPTVGVRSSGKTHMLVTAYDRIRKRTAPTVAVVQPAPSGGDVDRRFGQLIDEVLHRRGVAGATDLVLPDPVLVHLWDADPSAPSPALVNLFDYSGELINPDVDVNMLKATAVRMDGFMLFLDPTQLYGDGANVTLDQQLGMLDEFLNHMRRERRVPVGEVIPVPVAVCVPKFDLLLTDNPIGGQSVHYIRELTGSLNPPPRETTLATIRERGELVEQMLPLMFPGADIRAVVEGYFGRRVMFFPISSVSLFEEELGEKDLARRTIAPFGVAEPILWLLHMHGYRVFGGDGG
ncbi:MAG: hypothetical protein C0501_13620 [Isosphaera sp.]|nr:hypothetical protein [Isosphaera sp.]